MHAVTDALSFDKDDFWVRMTVMPDVLVCSVPRLFDPHVHIVHWEWRYPILTFQKTGEPRLTLRVAR